MVDGDDISADRTVDGYVFETMYCPIKSFERREGENFLRVVGDNDFQDVEIRISAEYMELMAKTLADKESTHVEIDNPA